MRVLAGFLLLLPLSLAAEIVRLEPLVTGLERPVQVVSAHDHTGDLYIAQQNGLVFRFDGNALQPFLDLRGVVACCENGGLLSIAFHPAYQQNAMLFALYADGNGDANIARVRSGTVEVLITVAQPKLGVPNHHGGTLVFGPDGFLYASIGDGGAVADVTDRAQDLARLQGKLLRISVDQPVSYSIPGDNPFSSVAGARAEIWSLGLRNPWRFSFDRSGGDMFLADVGHEAWEEVDILSVATARGANFGWPRMEGSRCFPPGASCDTAGLTTPAIEYSREGGCSITGGFRYRGSRWPALVGAYVYGDFCSGRIWAAIENGRGGWQSVDVADTESIIVSFGEDDDGELYLVDYAGSVLRLTAPSSKRRSVVRR